MILQYIFIKEYRTLKNQGLNFSNKYLINYSVKENKIEISENPFYIKDFFGKTVSCLTGIIGENGVGKTTILNYIKEVLSFPITTNLNNVDSIIVFYSEIDDKFLIATYGFKLSKATCSINSKSKLEIIDLKEIIEAEQADANNLNHKSILSYIEAYSLNPIVYFSNVFDARGEKDYGPVKIPPVYNLSTNYLTKGSIIGGETNSTYKNDELYKSIKLILNSKEHIPEIKLPKYLIVNIKNILIDEYLTVKTNYKGDSSYNDLFRDEITETLNKLRDTKEFSSNKRIRIQFWLCSYLLIQINDYYDNTKINEIRKIISESTIDNLQGKIIAFLITNFNYLSFKNEKRNIYLPNNFDWIVFFKNYDVFINTTLKLYDKHNNDEEFHSFKIPLIAENEKETKKLIETSESSSISLNLLSYSWHDLSTGETMLLRFFANIYVFAQFFKIDTPIGATSILFLFDEIETFYHPQWQKKLIKSMLDFINFHFKDIQIQIILTSHSPLIISDIPKTNLIFLRKVGQDVLVQKSLNDHRQTFASNIHSLLSDSFFLNDGLMGEFANDKISDVIDLLVDGKLKTIVEKKDYIESIINLIGEPVIKSKLIELLEQRLRANLISIKTDIDSLKKRK